MSNVLSSPTDLMTLFPEVAAEWDYKKNGEKTPSTVSPGSSLKFWWVCSAEGHSWETDVKSRTTRNGGCPYCSNRKILNGYNDLATTHPHIADEWDYRKNAGRTPDQISFGSKLKFWWKCSAEGHSWEAETKKRTTDNNSCPYCTNRKILKGYNDLATTHPQLAAEWDYEKNGDYTPAMIGAGSHDRFWWKCSAEGHSWETVTEKRTRRSHGCPDCVTYRDESEFCDMFSLLTNHTFVSSYVAGERNRYKGNKIQVDMIDRDIDVVIEYDGYYAHGANTYHKKTWEERVENDMDTTQALLRNGYKVIRIRENPLKHMPMEDANLFQISFDSKKNDKASIVEECVEALSLMNVNIEIISSDLVAA